MVIQTLNKSQMKKLNFLLLLPILLLTLTLFHSCSNHNENQEYNSIQQLKWICDTWQNVSDSVLTKEEWAEQGDTLLSGIGLALANNKDTLFYERLRIGFRNNILYYMPTLQGQNNEKEVLFKLTALSDTHFVFENPMHDFPQKISYSHRTKNELYAEVEGLIAGKTRKEGFRLSRAN
jgi:hypothetical protein